MQRIAHFASRGKHSAANAVEEFLHESDLQYEPNPNNQAPESTFNNAHRGKEPSPMQVQMADTRMSWVKANNVDLYLTLLSAIAAIVVFAADRSPPWHT